MGALPTLPYYKGIRCNASTIPCNTLLYNNTITYILFDYMALSILIFNLLKNTLGFLCPDIFSPWNSIYEEE